MSSYGTAGQRETVHDLSVAIITTYAIWIPLTGIICVELLLFGKLRFQRERLVFSIMLSQTLLGMAGVIMITPELSNDMANLVTKNCYRGQGLVVAFGTASSWTSVLLETFQVLIANYSLFLGRKEIKKKYEYWGYALLVLFWVFSAGLLSHYFVESFEHLMCHYEEDLYTKLTRGAAIASLFLNSFLLVTYIILLVRRTQQCEFWREARKALSNETIGRVERQRKLKVIETHETIVNDIIGTLNGYLIAFAFGAVATIIGSLGTFIQKDFSPEQQIHFLAAMLGFGFQRPMQAYAYFRIKSNRENYSLAAWCNRMNRVSEQGISGKVKFAEEADLFEPLVLSAEDEKDVDEEHRN